MTSLWQENFDFYEARVEKGRALISLDLAAVEHAPVASHPVRVQFRVDMVAPREDGLRSEHEAPALFALEDRLVAAMQERGALYVARTVAYGKSEFIFYVAPEHREAGRALAKQLGDTPYALQWLSEEDPAWERYEELFPDAWSHQTILNRRLLAQMVRSGDQLEVRREVDHGAWFPSRLQAEAASAALAEADFRVDPPRPPTTPEALWFLEFHRDETCADGEPDEFVFEVFELIEPHDGSYDGWGSALQLKPA